MLYRVKYNPDEMVVRLDDQEGASDLVMRCDRVGVKIEAALSALAQPWIGWGAYPLGVIKWDGGLVMLYGDSAFPRSYLDRLMEQREGVLKALGIGLDDIEFVRFNGYRNPEYDGTIFNDILETCERTGN